MRSSIFGVLMALVACGKGDRWDGAISEMDGLRARMCACKDAACANGVAGKIKEWERGMDKKFGETKPPDRIATRAKQIEADTRTCYEAAAKPTAAAPSPEASQPVDAAADPVLAKMVGFRDRMCACKDQGCIDKVNADMTKFGNEQVLDPIVTPATTTTEHANQMMKASKQIIDCMMKVMSAH